MLADIYSRCPFSYTCLWKTSCMSGPSRSQTWIWRGLLPYHWVTGSTDTLHNKYSPQELTCIRLGGQKRNLQGHFIPAWYAYLWEYIPFFAQKLDKAPGSPSLCLSLCFLCTISVLTARRKVNLAKKHSFFHFEDFYTRNRQEGCKWAQD